MCDCVLEILPKATTGAPFLIACLTSGEMHKSLKCLEQMFSVLDPVDTRWVRPLDKGAISENNQFSFNKNK